MPPLHQVGGGEVGHLLAVLDGFQGQGDGQVLLPLCKALHKGMIDIAWTMKQVRNSNKDPSVVIKHWVPFQEKLSVTLALEEEWVKKSIAYVQQYQT